MTTKKAIADAHASLKRLAKIRKDADTLFVLNKAKSIRDMIADLRDFG